MTDLTTTFLAVESSPSTVPEPQPVAVVAIGGLLLAWRHARVRAREKDRDHGSSRRG
jgi:hypothetical protein